MTEKASLKVFFTILGVDQIKTSVTYEGITKERITNKQKRVYETMNLIKEIIIEKHGPDSFKG